MIKDSSLLTPAPVANMIISNLPYIYRERERERERERCAGNDYVFNDMNIYPYMCIWIYIYIMLI